MNLLIWVYLAQAAWPSVLGIYFEGMREIFKPQKDVPKDSYFGYSITYDQQIKKLVISAPAENDIGEVYDCNIENKVCTPIVVTEIKRLHSNYTHFYWFGATVKAGPDFVVMCAPRYTAYMRYENISSYASYGMCLSRKGGNEIKQLPSLPKEQRAKKGSNLEDYMDSYGWSIDVASDNSIIIGGPGMYHGRAMFMNSGIPKPKALKIFSTPEFNFGYSVTSGNFITDSDEKEQLIYVVGSTYGKDGYGEVTFFKDTTRRFALKKAVDTDVVGSMFGAVLCAANLTGHKSDLLVGAPTYGTQSDYNLGAVYVYKASVSKIQQLIYVRKIVGKKSGAQFGSAIITLGDLNGDGIHEIAIGAPFDDKGKGAVYLYSGADLVSQKAANDLRYIQKIEPEPSYVRSFGMSLTSLLDYDKNGCNELAIGSPYTNKVLLLRCMASVTVKTYFEFPNLQGRTSSRQTKFSFKVCLDVKYPKLPEKVIANLSTMVVMSHPDAKLVRNSPAGFSFNTSLHDKKPPYCTEVPFILPVEGAYHIEIICKATSVLLDDPRNRKDFDSSRVILSDLSVLNIRDSIWAAECAGKKCLPNLKLTYQVSFQSKDEPYIIGSTETEDIEVSVYNDGEVAYDMCLRVYINDVPISKSPPNCHLEGSELLCAPSHPLQNGQTWSTGKILLEMKHLTNLNKNVTFGIALFNYCKEPVTKSVPIVTEVKTDMNGIVIKGETDIGMYVNMTEEDVKINGKKMQHVYTIKNDGYTNFAGFDVQVILQKRLYLNYDRNPVTMYFSKTNAVTECMFIKEDDKEQRYLCQIESLMAKDETAKIFIPMYIVPGTLDEVLEEKKNMTIKSDIKLLLPDDVAEYGSINTIIMLQEAEVPLKWIIIGVCVGILVIIITAIVLYKVGFLRRKKKEELNKLRKSIRRQTILRRSTMPSHGRPSVSGPPDDTQILEVMNEEGEDDHTRP